MLIFIIIGCCILTILLILFCVFLFAKFKFRIIVHNRNIKIYFARKKIYDSIEKNCGHKTETQDTFEKKYENMKHIINIIRKVIADENGDIISILNHSKKTLSVRKLNISLDYGFDDAAITGVTGGVIWSLISALSAFVERYIDFRKFTNVAVKPHYTEKILEFNLECDLFVSFYHCYKIIKHFKRFKKTLEGGR